MEITLTPVQFAVVFLLGFALLLYGVYRMGYEHAGDKAERDAKVRREEP